MTYKHNILMNPGPVNLDERVRAAMNNPDMCHREPEFAELMTTVRRKLTLACGGDERYTTVVITGSGTAALEAAIASVVPPQGKLLVLSNGHYGERLRDIAAVDRVPHEVLEFGWAQPIDVEQVRRALAGDPSLTHVAMIHHETSTGMLNPVASVGETVAQAGRSLIVDAISSLGGETFNVVGDHVDWCVGTANKCLESVPGLSFVCATRKNFDGLAGIPPRSFYLDLAALYNAEERKKAPAFTPAIPAFMALNVALDLFLREGVLGRAQRYAALALRLRKGLRALGLKMLLAPEHMCNTLTAIYLPEGLTYEELHGRLKESGFVIYAAQDALSRKVFRLANMGQITAADMGRFLAAMEAALSRRKVAIL